MGALPRDAPCDVAPDPPGSRTIVAVEIPRRPEPPRDDPAGAPLSVHGHGYVAESDEQAVEDFYGPYAAAMTALGRERGWGPMTREQFEWMRSPEGSLVLGSPQTVAAKILRWREILGVSRFELHISVGTLPHEKVLRSIELLGTKVAPIVNEG